MDVVENQEQPISENKLTESTICDKLNSKYVGNCKYKVANVFVFKNNWESDFFVQKQNGYSYEFEVKVTRADFIKDKKKLEKHLILSTGKFDKKTRTSKFNKDTELWDYETNSENVEHELRPNKFYYVVPENLIKVEEVPEYAGLMYVPKDAYGDIKTVKEAPFIHKNKLDFEKILCNKFYNYWHNEKRINRLLKLEIDALNYKIESLKKENNA